MSSSNRFDSRFSAFKIAYSGVICALTILIMFAGVIPALTYIMPAIAGILIWSVSIQINPKWGLLSYISVTVLSLILVPEIESKTFFIMLFGYYPLLRGCIHRVGFRPVRFMFKLALFNVTAVISYSIVVYVFGVSDVLDGLEFFGEKAVYAFWGLGNVAFFLYDFSLSYVCYAFEHWVKPVVNRKIK